MTYDEEAVMQPPDNPPGVALATEDEDNREQIAKLIAQILQPAVGLVLYGAAIAIYLSAVITAVRISNDQSESITC